ncbi:hypothetical protein [Ralstonia pseudosolanacearum]|uniref:hypothetical protein n=1 Tax=Ralstonia pseudosolanacearum TaxID=1310165 RepID=UPI003CEEE372
MRNKIATLVLAVSSGVFPCAGSGQPVGSGQFAKIDNLVKSLLSHERALNDLRPALKGEDRVTVFEIEEVTMGIEAPLDQIGNLLMLREAMIADADRQEVSQVLKIQAEGFSKLCSLNATQLNASMGFAHNAALVLEAQEIKKLLSNACTVVESLR